MTAEEFWHGDPRLAPAYREAYRIRFDNRRWAEWRVGAYVREALLAASPAFRELSKGIDHAYPELPFGGETPEEREERKRREQMELNIQRFREMAAKANQKLAERRAEEQRAEVPAEG
jgi:hypothetical protein